MTGFDRRTLFKAGVFAAGATALPLAASAAALGAPNSPRVLATKLQVPWSLAFLPDGNALTGERDTLNVHRILKGGGRRLVGKVGGGATKLFGLALSPTYRTDKLLYAHVRTATDARVLAMTYTAATGLGTPTVIFGGIPHGTDHHGGGLIFRPDGAYLYVSVGDKGTPDEVQNLSSLTGKILRIRPDGTVPADNPWGSAAFARGFRNPEGMAFDGTGKLYAVEFGEDEIDELNRVVKGQNYGWPGVEGGDNVPGGIADPIASWRPTSTCSPAGVAVKGSYAYVGALMGRCIFVVDLTTGDSSAFFEGESGQVQFGRIRAVQAAPDGSLWMTTSNNDGVNTKVAADDRVIRFLS